MPLSIPELATAAKAAGFSGDTLIMAVAISIRESGGDPSVVGDRNNPNAGCQSNGLMQINVCPQYNNKGVWFRENPELLFDPINNFKAAYEMSGGGQNFGPWSTYRAGIPAPDLERVKKALVGVDFTAIGAPTIGIATAVPDAAGGVLGSTLSGVQWLSNQHNLLRILEGIIGMVAVMVGVTMTGFDLRGLK